MSETHLSWTVPIMLKFTKFAPSVLIVWCLFQYFFTFSLILPSLKTKVALNTVIIISYYYAIQLFKACCNNIKASKYKNFEENKI